MKKAEILLEYQEICERPFVQPKALYRQACSNDEVTINHWRDIWLGNIRANRERFGSFKDLGIGEYWGAYQGQPCIVAGSGPSLSKNIHLLKERRGINLVSCLHNFHFMEDSGADPDIYVSLDAGDITLEELYEGGKHDKEYYLEKSKGRTLFAYIGSSPKLLEAWRGEIRFFACPVPDKTYCEEVDAIEKFHTVVSNGGNVLGACLYIAKGILGCNPIIYIGADFSFSYLHKFHGWDSKYDANLGAVVHMTDVFGNRVKSWQSYANFKSWFDYIAMTVPGIYLNCTEGGCLGSYPEGNIPQIRQMDLSECLDMYNMNKHLKNMCDNPETDERTILF